MDVSKLRVEKPCPADWAEMTGDERARHCDACQKTVYNLTEMTEAEAAAFVAQEGRVPCIRYMADETGAPIFKGSPTWLRLAAAGAFISVAAAGCSPETPTVEGSPVSSVVEPIEAAKPPKPDQEPNGPRVYSGRASAVDLPKGYLVGEPPDGIPDFFKLKEDPTHRDPK